MQTKKKKESMGRDAQDGGLHTGECIPDSPGCISTEKGSYKHDGGGQAAVSGFSKR